MKKIFLQFGIVFLAATLFATLITSPKVEAQLTTANFFYGARSEDCGSGYRLIHPRKHKDSLDGNTYTYYCVATSNNPDTYRIIAAGDDDSCNTPIPKGFDYDRAAIDGGGFGKLCIHFSGNVLYKQGQQPPAAPGSTPSGGTGNAPISGTITGGTHPGSTSTGTAAAETAGESRPDATGDFKDAAQGDCADGYIEVGVPIGGEDIGEDKIAKNCVKADTGSVDENPIWVYLRRIIQFITSGVGLIIVLMIVISGIQYITSAGNPQGVSAAKTRLAKAIGSLFLFIFFSAIVNFLVPGGLFK